MVTGYTKDLREFTNNRHMYKMHNQTVLFTKLSALSIVPQTFPIAINLENV